MTPPRSPALFLFGLLAAGPAVARERAVPAAESIRPCPSEGPGFVRLGKSATCIRLSGRVVAGVDAGPGGRDGARTIGDGRLAIDTRVESDYGAVRTFVRVGAGR
jgi:hypothetical protein